MSTSDEQKKRLKWWQDARFGMFIHWGLYSLPVEDWNYKQKKSLNDLQYQKYFDNFDPDLYNPRDWARMAKNAGMKYAVITSKHIEGFCLFDSAYTDYSAMHTPCRKDLIKEWAEAFHAEGLKIGFYYGLMDWHHPHFTVDRLHPQRGPLGTKEEYDFLNKERDMAIYRSYMKNQLNEILTKYGKIDLLFLDWSYPGEFGKGRDDWGSEEIIRIARQLQPDILINDRADMYEYPEAWDFVTPEQNKVKAWPEKEGRRLPWEVCYTMSGSWGYNRDELEWKDNKQLLVLLIETVSKGGNLILNVGPTGRGTFDHRAQKVLEGIGQWMKDNSRSIYGCTQAPECFRAPDNTLLTWNPETKRLYVHLLDYPLQRLYLSGLKEKVKYAQFLHDASELQTRENKQKWDANAIREDDLILDMPIVKPDTLIPVVELMMDD